MSIAAGQKIKASHIPIVTPYNVTNVALSQALTNTMADASGMTQTFTTLYANAIVIVTICCDFSVTTAIGATGLCGGQIVIDGSAQAAQAATHANTSGFRQMATMVGEFTLASSGSHTIKLQARKTINAGVASIEGQSKLTIHVWDQDVS